MQPDATTVKARPVASTGGRRRGGKKAGADARRCLGRSRGGPSTKPHAAVDRRGRLLRLVPTPGRRGDCPLAGALLSGPGTGTVGHVIADAAYDSDDPRGRVRRLRARCCVKPNPTRKRRKRYDRRRYRHRNVVERFFCRIRRCRRVATRYEKKAEHFAGFVYLAAFITAEG